ncbi:uncharacterized protein LOC135152193 [Daucus carota subsp. sativus]|uniref:uncharacterized protein LOC135152193 n=1 Tax=Daucus carota subsp. sativus TaxID=79200 RepID=UPI0030830D7E
MNRFTKEALKVPDLDQKVAMIALQQGTTDDNFRRSLAKRAPENMNELQERAGKYIKAEESLKKSQNNQGPTPNPKKRGNDTEYNADSKYSKTGDGDKSPTKKKAGPRFTEFHKDTGHKTDDCRQLKDEIEFLIQKGKLSKYTRDTDKNPRDNDNRGRDNDDRNKRNQPRGPVINVISGGPTAAGLSSNSRKAYAREVMYIVGEPPKRAKIEFALAFDNLDLDRVKFPHDDPLVITPVIGNSSVKRVLVDGGASVDILFHDAYEKMGYSDSQLTPSDMPIYGFNNVETKIEAIPSTYHLKIKFPTKNGVGEEIGDQKMARSCYVGALKSGGTGGQVLPIEDLDVREEEERRGKPAEDLVPFSLYPDEPEKVTYVGASLPEDMKSEFVKFLRNNRDVFAWTAADMPGIDPLFMTHTLNVSPDRKPVKQKKRSFAPERQEAIKQEVDKLLEAGFIEEIQFPEWLANPVMVKKANGKWRMCVDFTDLNDACPKDCFPLPRIDTLIDATAGHEMLSFMDGFSGYNQIRMNKDDIPKVSFITDFGIFCYLVMAFGLKNAGATYQRLANKMFKHLIGKTMECAFGVGSGKFLGLMVSKRGIEANPDKIKAILDMEPPKSIKDVQKLTGRIAALGRFISKSGDKCLPFFKALKKVKDFEWTSESQEAFEQLKKYMAEPPLLSKPVDGETLYVYLAVSEKALSAVLVPSRKLRPYFQAHKIEVLTDQPLRNIMHSPKASGRLIKWAVELGEFEIRYKPRVAIKAQALADFLVECTIDNKEVGGQESMVEEPKEEEKPKEYWLLFFDGASKTKNSGAGLVLRSPDGFTVEYAIKLDFPTTNNEAEYEALIAGLGLARTLRVKNLKVCGDSRLVVSQVNGEFEAREETMLKYLRIVKAQMTQFKECLVEHIPREENTKADALSQFASSENEVCSGSVYYQVLKTPSINAKLVAPIDTGATWIDEVKTYLETGHLPPDAGEARKLQVRALKYALIEGILYKKSFVIPYLKCLRPDEAREALKEVHEGICGQHLGGRALAHKITRLGFFWPNMLKDAKDYVKRCDRCQRFAPVVRQPPEMLTSINSPIPFAMWGMDILGPFPLASAQRKFLIVAIDYFTKWIEAKPLAKITTKQVAQFFWENVICRYGIPRVLVTDNGAQFNNPEFVGYCNDYSIELRFTSVAHPQANGQAEVANRIILDGLKKRVEKAHGSWAEEILPILWAYRTTCKVSTGATPFQLAYAAEAVVPLEITHTSPRVQQYEPEANEEGMRLALDMIDEVRDEANARIVESQKRASYYYNLRVKERFFRKGDLVLRKAEASGVGPKGKMAQNWEGPYQVKDVIGRGSYKLQTLDGVEFPRSWHATNLKIYYI